MLGAIELCAAVQGDWTRRDSSSSC